MTRRTKPSRRTAFRRWALLSDHAVAALRLELAPAVVRVATTGNREVLKWRLLESLQLVAIDAAVRAATARTAVCGEVVIVSSRGSYPVVLLTRRGEVSS